MCTPTPKTTAKAPHEPRPVTRAGRPTSQPTTLRATAASVDAVTRTRMAMAVDTGAVCGPDDDTSSSPLTGPAEPFTLTVECGAADSAAGRGPLQARVWWECGGVIVSSSVHAEEDTALSGR